MLIMVKILILGDLERVYLSGGLGQGQPVVSLNLQTCSSTKEVNSFTNTKLCSFGNINVVQLKHLFLYTDHCLSHIVFFILYRPVALHQNLSALGISMLLIETSFLYRLLSFSHCVCLFFYKSVIVKSSQSISLLYQQLLLPQKHHTCKVTHIQQQYLCSQNKLE